MPSTLTLVKQLRRKQTFEARLRREENNLAMCRRGLKRNGITEMRAEEIIQQAVDTHGNKLTLGWSGGECSTVCLHMALEIKSDIHVLYNNTGVEFPENVQYVHEVAKEWNLNLTEINPEATFFSIVKKFGFPQYSSRSFGKKRQKWNNNPDRAPMCCHLLKDRERYLYYRTRGITGDVVGLRAPESRMRAIHIGKMGQIYPVKDQGKKRRPKLIYYLPVALWTIKEVKNYLQNNNVPVNPVYETQTRNGCWACTAYKGWERNLFNYNPRMLRMIKHLMGDRTLDSFLRQEIKPACGER